jgi:hypothetical protein
MSRAKIGGPLLWLISRKLKTLLGTVLVVTVSLHYFFLMMGTDDDLPAPRRIDYIT